MKLPMVSIYLTPEELKEQLANFEAIKEFIPEGEKLVQIRFEGIISYSDYKKIHDIPRNKKKIS